MSKTIPRKCQFCECNVLPHSDLGKFSKFSGKRLDKTLKSSTLGDMSFPRREDSYFVHFFYLMEVVMSVRRISIFLFPIVLVAASVFAVHSLLFANFGWQGDNMECKNAESTVSYPPDVEEACPVNPQHTVITIKEVTVWTSGSCVVEPEHGGACYTFEAGPRRSTAWVLRVYDKYGNEVISLSSPLSGVINSPNYYADCYISCR